jgi:hypothetical protein
MSKAGYLWDISLQQDWQWHFPPTGPSVIGLPIIFHKISWNFIYMYFVCWCTSYACPTHVCHIYILCTYVCHVWGFFHVTIWSFYYPPLQTYTFGYWNTIYVHTIYVSYTVCVSWINKSSDVRFTNLKLWHVALFICPRWLWLCVIQYFVWWLILRYCYTYDIYINIPSRNHIIFNSVQIQDMSIFKICQ